MGGTPALLVAYGGLILRFPVVSDLMFSENISNGDVTD